MSNTLPKPVSDDQRALAASEARFRALVHAASVVVYRMSGDWNIMQELDGRSFLTSSTEPITDWQLEYLHPDDQPIVKAAIADAIISGSIFQLEHRVKRTDGSWGWVSSRAIPIVDEQGQIIEWFGTAADISDRKMAEQALYELNENNKQQVRLYETITSSTPDLIYVFNLDYHFTYANEALLTMWGKTWDTAVGKGLRENGYEEWHAQMHEREIDHVRKTKESVRGEVSFPHAALGRRVYDYILNPVFNNTGEVIAVAGTTRDITDIRNAELALSETEARFRVMAEGTDVLITVGDETGKAVYFNEAWTKATGRTNEELLRNGWIDLMHPDDRDRVTHIFTTALKEHKPWHWEFRMPDKKGGYTWLLARGTPRFRNEVTFVGYISSTVDITEMKENEQRKNDFISMVSHELKTPLTSLSAHVQVLRSRAAKTEDAFTAAGLDNALKQIKKMTGMINGFLNVSRLESGKMGMDRRYFDMADLITEAGQDARAEVVTHQIIISQVEPAMVYADRDKISQVINNFVSNAAKYAPNGSPITVGCKISAGRVIVSVSDEGIGIPQEELPRLFERYYRVKGNENKHVSGFGIGLYICSEIVKGNNGDIWAESNQGKGSIFYFSLPLVVEQPAGAEQKPD